MVHSNARLTPLTRLELVQQVQAGWPQAEVARQFRVSRATVNKWVRRYRQAGAPGLADRSSRPHTSPKSTPAEVTQAVIDARRGRGWGPHRISWLLGIARSTVYAVLRRAGLNRLAWLHRTTRAVVRYQRQRPGELVHLDVKKLGRIPPGGGKRLTPGAYARGGPHGKPRLGFDFIHVAVDDHSRYAYAEALADERAVTAIGFLKRALAHFRAQGIPVQRVLTDNGSAYTSKLFAQASVEAGLKLKHTRPYRPQTNGKAEAFIKILQAEWAYSRPYHSNSERLGLLSDFLTYYNHARPHGGIGGLPPVSRL